MKKLDFHQEKMKKYTGLQKKNDEPTKWSQTTIKDSSQRNTTNKNYFFSSLSIFVFKRLSNEMIIKCRKKQTTDETN